MITASAEHFSIGNVLGQGYDILEKNIIAFGLIALAVTFPSFLYQLISGGAAVATNVTTTDGGVYVERSVTGGGALMVLIIELVLRQVAIGAISYGVFQEMRGQRADVADACAAPAPWSLLLPVSPLSLQSPRFWRRCS